jgi:hypothetical protein
MARILRGVNLSGFSYNIDYKIVILVMTLLRRNLRSSWTSPIKAEGSTAQSSLMTSMVESSVSHSLAETLTICRPHNGGG